MRQVTLLGVDIALILLATLCAFVLRENFEVQASPLVDLLPYLIATAGFGLLVWPLAGLNRTIWRFTSLHDILRICAALSVTVAGAAGLGFAYNRLEGVARSLPLLQMLTATAFLTGARVLHKLSHDSRRRRKTAPALLQTSSSRPLRTVLIVGLSPLAEFFLQAAAEVAPGGINVAGFVGRRHRHTGRLVATYPVLGVPESIEAVLEGLEVHGVTVDLIVVAESFADLSAQAKHSLLAAVRSRGIEFRVLEAALGLSFDGTCDRASGRDEQQAPGTAPLADTFLISCAELEMLSRRRYWLVKRAIDGLGSFVLLSVLSPLIILLGLAVWASGGSPILFWQERPGLGGKPFRLYKFRTMRAAFEPGGRPLSDSRAPPPPWQSFAQAKT